MVYPGGAGETVPWDDMLSMCDKRHAAPTCSLLSGARETGDGRLIWYLFEVGRAYNRGWAQRTGDS